MPSRKLGELVLDLFFPKKCVGCGKKGDFLCLECIAKIEYVQELICPACHRPAIDGTVHPRCQTPFSLDRLLTMAYYEEVIKKAILASKFQYLEGLTDILSEILCQWLEETVTFNPETIVTSVPLHPQKLKMRGFNQSALLAQKVSDYFSLNFKEDILAKIKKTLPQSKLTKKRREKNLFNAFRCQNSKEIKGKTILLVDDIVTTGTTLKECCKALKRKGAKEVIGLTLVRGK